MEKLDLSKKNLKKFAITLGICFLIISLTVYLRHRHSFVPTAVISGVFFIFGLTTPGLLKPIYIFWMGFASILGWINARLILLVIFYLIFAPIGLILRLLRKDLLDINIEKSKVSYWRKKENTGFDPSSYERKF